MNFRVVALLAVGLLAGMPSPVRAADPADEANVQKLGDVNALRVLGSENNAAKRRAFVRSVTRAYQADGYPRLGAALSTSGSVITLLGQPELAERRGALVRARATVRNVKRALQAEKNVTPSLEIGETTPNYLALADVFTSNAEEAFANLAAGRNVTRGLPRKRITAWVKRNADGTIRTGGTYGVIVTAVGFINATLSLPATPEERWVIFLPGVGIAETIESTLSIWAYESYLDPASGHIYPRHTNFRRVSVNVELPEGATAFAAGPQRLHAIWGTTGSPAISTLNNHYFGEYAIVEGTWYLLAPGQEIPEGFEGLVFSGPRKINDVEFETGTVLLRGSLPAPAGATPLPVPFLISAASWPTLRESLTGGEITVVVPTPTPSPSPTPAE